MTQDLIKVIKEKAKKYIYIKEIDGTNVVFVKGDKVGEVNTDVSVKLQPYPKYEHLNPPEFNNTDELFYFLVHKLMLNVEKETVIKQDTPLAPKNRKITLTAILYASFMCPIESQYMTNEHLPVCIYGNVLDGTTVWRACLFCHCNDKDELTVYYNGEKIELENKGMLIKMIKEFSQILKKEIYK